LKTNIRNNLILFINTRQVRKSRFRSMATLGFALLALSALTFSAYSALAAAPTCSGLGPNCTVTSDSNGCTVGVHSCCITQDSVTYKVINSTGKVLFVPAKAGSGNWASFYNHLPSGVSLGTCP
jgi:hypothetical protein